MAVENELNEMLISIISWLLKMNKIRCWNHWHVLVFNVVWCDIAFSIEYGFLLLYEDIFPDQLLNNLRFGMPMPLIQTDKSNYKQFNQIPETVDFLMNKILCIKLTFILMHLLIWCKTRNPAKFFSYKRVNRLLLGLSKLGNWSVS